MNLTQQQTISRRPRRELSPMIAYFSARGIIKKITNIDMIKNNSTTHRHGNLFVFLIMRDDAAA